MAEIGREKIVIVGYGWVGQANALALSKLGYDVCFFDTSEQPTLHYDDEEAYATVQRVTSLESVDSPDTWYVVCVGDRVRDDGFQDISFIKEATDALRAREGKVVLRSTVLPQKLHELHFHIYLPEFLHEKNAVAECLTPHYSVIGVRLNTKLPSFVLRLEARAYRTFRGTPEEASYVKYLSNIWNSIRIAFVNEYGDAMGDPRDPETVLQIERVIDFVLERRSYVRYGHHFDGHCLPKDTRAFMAMHRGEGKNVDLIEGAYTSNEHHKGIAREAAALPKVYSFWEYTTDYTTILSSLWRALNDIALVRKMRKELQFVMNAVDAALPDRSTERAISIWEKKARENARYYSNTYTPSGVNVTEAELARTGRSDFERYILGEPALRERAIGGTVLDFGCGTGRMTSYLSERFDTIYGLDVSETMLKAARERIGDQNIELTRYDGKTLPYNDKSFDVIFSYQTLQHVPTHKGVEAYMREFHRTLKDDGTLKVQLRGGRGVKRWEWSYGASYAPYEAIRLAERTGFRVRSFSVENMKNIWLVLEKGEGKHTSMPAPESRANMLVQGETKKVPKSLITGGAGSVGYYLAKRLLEEGHDVVIADNFSRGKRDKDLTELLEHPHVKLIETDLTKREGWDVLGTGYDYIYQLASVNGTKLFYEIPGEVLRIGVSTILHSLDWMKATNPTAKILYTSSNEAYAGALSSFGQLPIPTPENVPLVISDTYNPRWTYAGTKLIGELFYIHFAKEHGLRSVIVRPHNFYGPRSGYDHVIPEFIERIEKRVDPFPIYGADDTRTFCYLEDAVRAMQLIMESEATDGGTYHIGQHHEHEISIEGLAEKLFSIAGWRPSKLDIQKGPEGSVKRRAPSTDKITEHVGFVPEVSLDEGLRRTYEWYKKNPKQQ